MDVLTDVRGELTERGRRAALAVAALVESLDPSEAARATPGLEWTATETAVHVVNLYGRALGDFRRSQTPDETAALNATCIAEFGERDPKVVADRIAADAITVWDQIFPMIPDDLEVPFHAGSTSTIVPIMGVVLMEMLVHGDDIARAADRDWEISDDDAWCALSTILWMLPAWRRAETPASDTIAFPGPAREAVRITCDGDSTIVSFEPLQPGDRVVAEAPSVALLGLFGRRPSEPPLSELATRFGPF